MTEGTEGEVWGVVFIRFPYLISKRKDISHEKSSSMGTVLANT